MTVSNVSSIRHCTLNAASLFERLPTKLFSPLASANREGYWALLCRLHHRRFGPDAPLPPSQGYQSREIIADIEEFLADQDAWTEDGESPDTPLNIRAAGVYHRLLDAGWLRVDRHGPLEKGVSIRPAVSHFLSMLVNFAESGPIYLSGKINTIDAVLRSIIEGQASGESLMEAAQQARNLLEHVRTTGTLIRDLMDALSQDVTPAQYVHRFFNDYIERVFIADYRELRTREHPLSKRQQILRMIEELDRNEAHRVRILTWYEQQQKGLAANHELAMRQYERDLHRLYELQRIDEYLDRLDDEIRRANKRALAYLDYRLRAVRPVDHLVRHAIECINADKTDRMADPFPSGEMVSPTRLSEPRKTSERPPPSALRRTAPTAEEIARARVLLRAREARSVTIPKLSIFVQKHLAGADQKSFSELELSTIEDVRAYQALLTLSKLASSPSRRLQLAARTQMRGFDAQVTSYEEQPQRFISGAAFLLTPRHAREKEKK